MRPRSAVRRLAVAGLILLAAALLVWAAASALATSAERLRRGLEARLGAAVEGQVRIGALELRLAERRAVAHGVDVNVAAEAGAALTATAERIEVGFSLVGAAAMLRGEVRLRDVVVVRPVVAADWPAIDAVLQRQAARRSALRFRLGRLEVRDGSLLVEDRTVQLNFEASGLRLDGETRAGDVLAGHVAWSSEIDLPRLTAPWPVDVAGDFALHRGELTLANVHLVGPGLEMDVAGRVGLGGTAAGLVLEGEMRSDLAAVRSVLAADLPEVAGRVEGPVRLEAGGGNAARVSGRWRGASLRVGNVDIPAAEATTTLDATEWRLDDLRATGFGGVVRGSASTTLRAPQVVRLDLHGEGIDLAACLTALGRPLPLAATLSGTVRLEGPWNAVAAWNGGAQLVAAPAATGRLPLEGEVAIDLADGVLRATSSSLRGAAMDTRIDLSAEIAAARPTARLRVDGSSHDATVSRDGLGILLEQLGVALPPWVHEDLAGEARFVADLVAGDSPSLDVDVTLRDGRLAGERIDAAALEARMTTATIELRRLAMQGPDVQMEAAGTLRRGPLALEQIEVDASGVAVRRLARLAGFATDVEGSLSGSLRLRRGAAGLEGNGRIEVVAVTVMGETVERATAHLEVGAGSLWLRDVQAAGPAGTGVGEARIDLATGGVEAEVRDARLSLGSIEVLRRTPAGLEGQVRVSGEIDVVERRPRGGLRLEGEAVKVRGVAVGGVRGTLDFEPGGLRGRLGPAAAADWALDAEVDWEDGWPFRASIDVARGVSEIAVSGSETPAVLSWVGRGTLEGRLADPATMRGVATLERAALRLGGARVETDGPSGIRLEDGRLRAGPIQARGENSDIVATIDADLVARTLQASVRGTLNLQAVSLLVPDLRAAGAAAIDVQAAGGFTAPRWSGTVAVRKARVRSVAFGASVQDLDLDLAMENGRARLVRLVGVLGDGEVRGAGEMAMAGLRPGPFSAELGLSRVRLDYPRGFRGVYDGTLSVQGELHEFLVSGRLDLLRGVYSREFGQGFDAGGLGPEPDASEPRPDVYLNVELLAPGGVWLQNETARVEASVDLHVGGTLVRPEVTGRVLALEGGTVRLRDVEYRLQAASLDFTDLERINPYLELRAETRVREYDVSLRVRGRFDRFEYELVSSPYLSTQDILTLLTTGQTPAEAQAAGGAPAGLSAGANLAADAVGEVLMGGIEKNLRSALRLDRVNIDPFVLQSQADPTARVTVGKRVSRDLLLVYSTDLGSTENQIYRAEWDTTRKLKLAVERGADGGVGGDVSYGTRLGRRPAAPASGAADPPATGPDTAAPVVSVRIDGVPVDEAEALLALVPVVPGAPARRSQIYAGEEAIRTRLVRDGWIEARVTSTTDAAEVLYRVATGPRVTWSVDNVGGRERRRLERLLEAFWLERAFEVDAYEQARDEIRRDLEERGHFTAQVDLRRTVDSDGVRVSFAVDPGPEVRTESVRIQGNDQVSVAELLAALDGAEAKKFVGGVLTPRRLELGREAIRQHYRRSGFAGVRVASPRLSLRPDGSAAEVTYTLREGERVLLGALDASVPAPISAAEVVAWSGLAPQQPFSAAAVAQAETAVRSRLDALGYPEARVQSAVRVEQGAASVQFNVDPGARRLVGDVILEGQSLTRPKVIRRELTFAPGDPVSRERLVDSQRRLYRLGLFRSVRLDYAPIADDPERQQVRVLVEEMPPLVLGLGAGYDTESGIRASVSLTHENLGGYGRRVSFQGFASDPYWRGQVLFQDARLFNWALPSLLNVSREHRERDGFTEDTWSGALRVEKVLRKRLTSFLRYNLQNVHLSDVEDEIAVQEEKLESVRLGDVGYTIAYDGRDDPFAPRRGVSGSAEVRLFAPVLFSQASFVKAYLQGSVTYPAGRWGTLVAAARLGGEYPYRDTEQVPISERFFAGGDATVRGFPRDGLGPTTSEGSPAGGEAMLILNQEWRFPLWRDLRGILFVDAGNVWLDPGGIDPSDLRVTAGTGIRLETLIGPLRLEYGHKLDRRPGESRGEFYLTIGNQL